MSLEELEKKMAELEKLQTEAENAHAKLKAQIAELKALREELPEPPHPRPYPENDQLYYIITAAGEVIETNWNADHFDRDARKIGNVFKNNTAAEFAIERLKVLAEMREWVGNWNDRFTISVQPSNNMELKIFDRSMLCPNGEMRFASEKDAKNCIKAVGEERLKKYYFMIPEEETNNG